MRDPYEVLGVAKNASAKDIKSAYRKLAKEYHPDQNPDPKAKERFAAANQAYEIVGDEKNRAPSGADLNVTLDVTIEEAATAEKVTAMFPDGRKVAVKLPAYVEDGQTIRLKGQGEQGPGQPGDALVKIRFRRHPRYRIEGRDLHADLPVALADAVLGAKVAVETPTGRLAVNVSAWSSSDKVLRLKGRGLPEKVGGHGDLYAHVRLMLPEGGDSDLEALMRNRKR
ncbi:MAG: J domain-containing protein [Mesorhizobium sp.]|nr:MAG: J domain-containing protein [Mesorhizobium sp.]